MWNAASAPKDRNAPKDRSAQKEESSASSVLTDRTIMVTQGAATDRQARDMAGMTVIAVMETAAKADTRRAEEREAAATETLVTEITAAIAAIETAVQDPVRKGRREMDREETTTVRALTVVQGIIRVIIVMQALAAARRVVAALVQIVAALQAAMDGRTIDLPESRLLLPALHRKHPQRIRKSVVTTEE